jgi:hypothetical protein
MCCFTRPVQDVKNTLIFARPSEGNRQYIVYSMTYKAKEDLAMVLPLPVPKGSGEKAVEFINLKDYPHFFGDLARCFPPIRFSQRMPPPSNLRSLASPLEVIEVGEFEASFVPTIADFTRLDPRFRLPAGTWEKLPGYTNFGFAVFKLKRNAQTVHPMAFSFPRADGTSLFFPTVHIHDGKVHETADFHHTLFCQRGDQSLAILGWDESTGPAGRFVDGQRAQGIVESNDHCYRKFLEGNMPNRDTYLAAI